MQTFFIILIDIGIERGDDDSAVIWRQQEVRALILHLFVSQRTFRGGCRIAVSQNVSESFDGGAGVGGRERTRQETAILDFEKIIVAGISGGGDVGGSCTTNVGSHGAGSYHFCVSMFHILCQSNCSFKASSRVRLGLDRL